MRRALGVAAAVIVASAWLPEVAYGATPPDPSKITATCFAADNPNGPFSATNPVTLWAGSPLVLKLGYRNDDRNADPLVTKRIGSSDAVSEFAPYGRRRHERSELALDG